MSELKHTKGEWHVFARPIQGAKTMMVGTSPEDRICQTFRNKRSETEQFANARLIACAPEMLEILISHVKSVKDFCDVNWVEDCNDIIPLIEKATNQKIEDLL